MKDSTILSRRLKLEKELRDLDEEYKSRKKTINNLLFDLQVKCPHTEVKHYMGCGYGDNWDECIYCHADVENDRLLAAKKQLVNKKKR